MSLRLASVARACPMCLAKASHAQGGHRCDSRVSGHGVGRTSCGETDLAVALHNSPCPKNLQARQPARPPVRPRPPTRARSRAAPHTLRFTRALDPPIRLQPRAKWSRSARIRSNCKTFADFGQITAEVGRTRSKIGRSRPTMGQLWSIPGQFGRSGSKPARPETGQLFKHGPNSPDFDAFGPMSTESGPDSTKKVSFRPELP